ncbi:MAG: hypothetical protein RIT28_1838 [Pseudomonadota bacterium]
MSPRDVVLAFLSAVERKDAAALDGLLSPSVTRYEWPNLISPRGSSQDREGMLAGLAAGAKLLAQEQYEVLSLLVDGERVAAELRWRAILAVPALGLPAGGALKGRFAVFFTLNEGRIEEVHNYDCFEPFGT